MTIRWETDRNRYLVTVIKASARPGYQRIRRWVQSDTEATALEADITAALETYGKWPVEDGDLPLPPSRPKTSTQGTLREAASLALELHWKDTQYERVVGYVVEDLVSLLQARGCYDIDEIKSADLDAIIAAKREKGNGPSTINKTLYALSVINKVALKRMPPLASVTIPLKTLRGRRIEKWWLRPEDHQRTVAALRNPVDGGLMFDPVFADYIDLVVFQGLRVEETLRLEPRHVTGLGTPNPWLQPPGTKTGDSQNSIPVYPQTVEVLERAIERAKANRWTRLFPLTLRQAGDKWSDVRAWLGVSDIPTATLKALRRTFAWYANSRGMPTSTVQKVLRHKNIATTAGYLDLVGGGEVASSARYFSQDPTPPQTSGKDIGTIIQAYASTPGVTPEAVARFAKELMT